MILEKFKVCVECTSIGITDSNCVCVTENKYQTIELEFEVCECCRRVLYDGNPAKTEFNKKQLESL